MRIDFSSLPSVDRILATSCGVEAVDFYGHRSVVEAVRAVLADERVLLRAGKSGRDEEALAALAMKRLADEAVSSLRAVFNMTGTILHTNLGRAQLPQEAIAAANEAMRYAVALEYNLQDGKRGERDDHLRSLLCELTGAEDATIVNNNAAAVLLTLNTLAGHGAPAIISRGELIEIGGAFRMPDIMTAAGCRLIEVGTTNRTHVKDYQKALQAAQDDNGIILKVHTSNYHIEGFTKAVTTAELAALAQQSDYPLVEDLGSGTLIDLKRFGLYDEPTVRQTVEAGADIVTFSGDKLLGGPQAGFIVGKASLIAQINANPMKRTMRVDKMRLAALEAVLKLYKHEERLVKNLPTLRYIARPAKEIEQCAHRLHPILENVLGADFGIDIIVCQSQVGSGALPSQTIDSYGLAIRAQVAHLISDLAASMRRLPMPVIGRIKNDALILDCRTLDDVEKFASNIAMLSL